MRRLRETTSSANWKTRLRPAIPGNSATRIRSPRLCEPPKNFYQVDSIALE